MFAQVKCILNGRKDVNVSNAVYVCVYVVRTGLLRFALVQSSQNTRLDLLWVRFGSVFSFEISNFFIRGNGILCVLRCVLHTEWLNNTSSRPPHHLTPFSSSSTRPTFLHHHARLLINRTNNNIKNERKSSHSMFSRSFPDLASHYRYIFPIYVCARNSCYVCVSGERL